MNDSVQRLLVNWIVGAIAGTAVIAITSPLFVRSYIPLTADPLRGVWTLAQGHTFRWRSEGYADTTIGPLGMPGRTSLAADEPAALRVALWGDSQAEGVCVADDQKIFSQCRQISSGRVDVLPLARSGEDAADWITQMPRVEQQLGIDLHALMIVDLPDLARATDAPRPPPSAADVEQANAALAARLPAFIIQAARHLLTEADESTPRRLRFSIGPVAADGVDAAQVTAQVGPQPPAGVDWTEPVDKLRQASQLPILVLYAPVSPQIVGGNVIDHDPHDLEFRALRVAAERAGLHVADTRNALRRSARDGQWPHGFDNGQIGAGHLNAIGNQIVATELVAAAEQAAEQAAADAARRGN
jgi:hypothetical protein